MISRLKNELFESGEATQRMEEPQSQLELLTTFSNWRGEIGKTIATRPGASLIIAAAAGFLIGWWTKRK